MLFILTATQIDIWKPHRSIGSRSGAGMVLLTLHPDYLHFGRAARRAMNIRHSLREFLITYTQRCQPVWAPVAREMADFRQQSARPDGRFPRKRNLHGLVFNLRETTGHALRRDAAKRGDRWCPSPSKGTSQRSLTSSIRPRPSSPVEVEKIRRGKLANAFDSLWVWVVLIFC